MKSPKPIVAGALVAGGLLFTSAAAAVTLPEGASQTAKDQVEAFLAGLPDDAKSAGDARRQASETEATAKDTETDETKVEETDAAETTEEGGERPETHGSEVSALATSDETKALDGRERGALISELAQSNGGGDADAPETETADEDEADTAGAAGRERAAKARQGK